MRRSLAIRCCFIAIQACSSTASEEPQLARDDGGAGTTGGESGADAAVEEAGAGASGAEGGGGGGTTGGTSGMIAPSGGRGGGSGAAIGGAGGSGGRAGSGAAGVAGTSSAGGSAPGSCRGVMPAAHPAFAAIKRLATTQEEVRILVYGQSISEQGWWSKTKQWLQATYPGKKLVMEEHARGGCSSQCLIGHTPWFLDNKQYNRLPEDVFAWKPDLIIFHVYGDHIDYGYIMRAFKEGCDAFENYRSSEDEAIPQVKCTSAQRTMSQGYKAPEVLVQGDFVISRDPVQCPANPTPANWDCFMNESVIPAQVAQHGYTLQDNFHDWPKYIREHDLDPATLIQEDDTHLTEGAGTDVMFALTIPHLCHVP